MAVGAITIVGEELRSEPMGPNGRYRYDHRWRRSTGETREANLVTHERHLPMFVIDVLRYDIEQIPNIVTLLNARGGVGWRVFWPRDFQEEEVWRALRELLASGHVVPYIDAPEAFEIIPYDGEIGGLEQARALWFELTEKGWAAWESWEDCPVSDEDQPER